MIHIIKESLFFGVAISVGAYMLGVQLKKRFNIFIFNPLLVAITLTIAMLLILDIDYNSYIPYALTIFDN